MASGTFALSNYGGFTGTPWWEAQCIWSSTPNAADNTSSVLITIQMRHVEDEGEMLNQYTGFYNVLSGVTGDFIVETKEFAVVKTVTTNWTTLGSFTFTAQHDDDGNCTVAPNVRVYGASDTGAANTSRSTPADLEINLGSTRQKATITAAPNFNDSENPTIKYTNPMGNSVTALEACITNANGYTVLVPYRAISKTGSSYTFNLTTSERNALIAAAGDGTSVDVRFYVRTTIGTATQLSYLAKTFTVIADGPTITASIADVNSVTVPLTGGGTRFIRGRNSMSFSMTATGQKGATISSYAVTCGSQVIRSSSGTFYNIENDVVIFSATDSRGATSTKTIQLTAVDYIKLTCNQSVRMILDSDSSAQIALDMHGNYFSGSFGAKSNSLAVYVRHARNNEAMGDWVELTPLLSSISGGTYSLSTNMSGFDPSGTYTFQSKAVDALGVVMTAEYAVQFIPVFDWSKEDFNFNVPVTINGNLVVNGTVTQTSGTDPAAIKDYVVETGTTAMGTNGTWYWSKWKSGKAECYGRRNYGNMAVTTTWGNLFRSDTFSQDLPYGLFSQTPEAINIDISSANFGGWIAKHEASNPDSSATGSFIVVRPASATLSQAYISFYVVGRWK